MDRYGVSTRWNCLRVLGAVTAFISAWSASAQTPDPGQITDSFVYLGRGVPAVMYEPVDPGPKAATAIMIMHSGNDYLRHISCTEFSRRGYRALCANNSTSKSGRNTELDIYQAILELGYGVKYLRSRPDIDKIVLMGHSGGGVLMSAYQNIAENGPEACQGEEMHIKCPDTLVDLPAADGVMFLDSNYGLSVMALFSIDPAVVDESSGMRVDPLLDPYNPANGYDPQGSEYNEEFIERFQQGVARRNNALVAAALARLEKIESGQGQFTDDEPFVIPGAIYLGINNKLFSEDGRILARTRGEWPLLRPDGSVETTIIHSVRMPRGSDSHTASFMTGALKTTVRRYLSTFAIRVDEDFAYGADYIRGIDWESSITAPVGNVPGITVPLLAMGMTAGYEFMAAEPIYENAASEDRTIAFIEGATHVFRPCAACESEPGEYGDTVETLFNYADAWLSEPGRFR